MTTLQPKIGMYGSVCLAPGILDLGTISLMLVADRAHFAIGRDIRMAPDPSQGHTERLAVHVWWRSTEHAEPYLQTP